MTIDGVYGTRPDYLPKSMIRAVRVDVGGRPRIGWVGQPGVKFLDLHQHDEYEEASIRRFSRRSDGTVNWGEVSKSLVLKAGDCDSLDIMETIQEFMSDSNILVFFWDSLLMPSVEMKNQYLKAYISGIIAQVAEFWVYSPSGRVLIENTLRGEITAAKVPSA
ncbi:hypothetical protein [Nocardia sp. GTS18]|uniref:hypothetical protein n=1 Tax=Nocardia sp. GTS18 TaxID=1778064 RepID=UPI0015EFAE66|nr:hypothetical protein [Nocardia sp. GTS18]